MQKNPSRYFLSLKCLSLMLLGLLLIQTIWSPSSGSIMPDVYAGGGGFNCATAVNITVPVGECYQIQAFYSANGGSNRTNKTNRDTDTDICTWYGIGCSFTPADGYRVSSISLPNNGVVGSSLSYIAALTGLTSIDLSHNQINVTLDSSWSALVNLTGLNLSNNQFYGTLPSGWSSLVNLTNLDLSDNMLYGSVPSSWMTDLPNHQNNYIDLSNNCITSTSYTPAEQSWLTMNTTLTPQNICLIYSINTTEGLFSGTSSSTSVQVVSSGGSGVPIEVLPKSGYLFLKWSDGNTDNPRTDTNVISTTLVSAQMSPQFTLEYKGGVQIPAILSGTTTQQIGSGDDGTPVEAISPFYGYDFLRRNDGRTDNPRTDTNVVSNTTVTAVWRTSCDLMTQREVSLGECEALIDLYTNTNGESWTNNNNRYTDTPVCSWYGISCTPFGTGNIISNISLKDNNLIGMLPDSLSGLVGLTYFDLRQNQLYGSIPSSISTTWYDSGAPYAILYDNCSLQMTGYSSGMQTWLSRNAGLSDQRTCADLSVEQSIISLGPVSQGAVVRYLIGYANAGVNNIDRVFLESRPETGLTIQSSSLSYTTVLSGQTYFVTGDSCFDDLILNTTGVYATDFDLYAVSQGGPDMETFLSSHFGYPGGANRGAWLLDRWAINNPTLSISDFYASLMNTFYGDTATIANVHPNCGLGGSFDYYYFNLGSLALGETGSMTIDAVVTGTILGQTGVDHLVTIVGGSDNFYDSVESNNSFNLRALLTTGSTGGSNIVNLPSTITNSNRGGGGGGSLSSDYCPGGDFSPSYYDGSCGTSLVSLRQGSGTSSGTIPSFNPGINTIAPSNRVAIIEKSLEKCRSLRTTSLQSACLARQLGGTNLKKISRADTDTVMTRASMAKLIAEFAIGVMGRKIETDNSCRFPDSRSLATRQVCQLGLMGIDTDGSSLDLFYPDRAVTKSQFLTIVSRLLYSDLSTRDAIDQLYVNQIISSKSDRGGVTKGFILRTLYRIVEQGMNK